jgi:peroxiredoxin
VPGLPVGSEAPAFTVENLDGNAVSLGTLVGRGSLLLFFSEPGCGACDAALPEVARWQREHAGKLFIVPLSRGDASANRAKATKHGLEGLLLQKDQDVAELYLANATPSAVLIKDGMIASPLAIGIDAIRELVTTATLPPPLKKGDDVPALKLPDLTGNPVDLAELRGRRTLVVFWNPSCGFCQRMLGDLKAWEVARSEAAPQLLVISVGSRQANRGQGFRSRVVLDHKSVAGRLFGSTGTPSAVLVDENGRVASDVGVGAEEVFALAGRKTASEPIPA